MSPPSTQHTNSASDLDAGIVAALGGMSREITDLRIAVESLEQLLFRLVEVDADGGVHTRRGPESLAKLVPLHEVEAQRIEEDARADVLRSLELLSSADAGRALGSTQSDPRRVASAWRARGALLGLPLGRSVHFPAFQFDVASHRIRPGVADVNKLLNARADPWGVASWWISPSGWLDDDRSPLDLAVAGDVNTLRELATAVVGAA